MKVFKGIGKGIKSILRPIAVALGLGRLIKEGVPSVVPVGKKPDTSSRGPTSKNVPPVKPGKVASPGILRKVLRVGAGIAGVGAGIVGSPILGAIALTLLAYDIIETFGGIDELAEWGKKFSKDNIEEPSTDAIDGFSVFAKNFPRLMTHMNEELSKFSDSKMKENEQHMKEGLSLIHI